MEKNRELIWDIFTLLKFEKALAWIAETSFQNAEQVEHAILEKAKT